jgi:hypothetical protein
MDKRSAIATAGGVVASFVAGVAAVSFHWGLGNSTTSAAPASPAAARVKPIVKHRTVVVHRRAKPTDAGRTVVLPAPATSGSAVTMTSGSHASGGENEIENEAGED